MKTSKVTFYLDPAEIAGLDHICAERKLTRSQVIGEFIRECAERSGLLETVPKAESEE